MHKHINLPLQRSEIVHNLLYSKESRSPLTQFIGGRGRLEEKGYPNMSGNSTGTTHHFAFRPQHMPSKRAIGTRVKRLLTYCCPAESLPRVGSLFSGGFHELV